MLPITSDHKQRQEEGGFQSIRTGRLFARHDAQIPGGENTPTCNPIQESYLFFFFFLPSQEVMGQETGKIKFWWCFRFQRDFDLCSSKDQSQGASITKQPGSLGTLCYYCLHADLGRGLCSPVFFYFLFFFFFFKNSWCIRLEFLSPFRPLWNQCRVAGHHLCVTVGQ